MKKVASDPKRVNNLDAKDLNELHADCKVWFSEIAFWKDELNFLKTLPISYAPKLEDINDLIKLKFLAGKVNGELTEELKELDERAEELETMLAALVQNSSIIDEGGYKANYKRLAGRMDDYRTLHEDIRNDLRSLLKNAVRKSHKKDT